MSALEPSALQKIRDLDVDYNWWADIYKARQEMRQDPAYQDDDDMEYMEYLRLFGLRQMENRYGHNSDFVVALRKLVLLATSDDYCSQLAFRERMLESRRASGRNL